MRANGNVKPVNDSVNTAAKSATPPSKKLPVSTTPVSKQLQKKEEETDEVQQSVYYSDLKTNVLLQTAEAMIKVTSQSRKFESNAFSIIHLNGHNFRCTGPIPRK